MSIGFIPSKNTRQAIYGVRVSRKLGYVEHDQKNTYFCDASGKKIARILKFNAHPSPECSAAGAFYVPPDMR